MKLQVIKPGQSKVTVDGVEARHALRDILKSISDNCLIPEMPFTGKVRRQVVDALKSGRPIWDEPNEFGGASSASTVVTMPIKIVGVIRADGTWDGDGPDPRVGPSETEGDKDQAPSP